MIPYVLGVPGPCTGKGELSSSLFPLPVPIFEIASSRFRLCIVCVASNQVLAPLAIPIKAETWQTMRTKILRSRWRTVTTRRRRPKKRSHQVTDTTQAKHRLSEMPSLFRSATPAKEIVVTLHQSYLGEKTRTRRFRGIDRSMTFNHHRPTLTAALKRRNTRDRTHYNHKTCGQDTEVGQIVSYFKTALLNTWKWPRQDLSANPATTFLRRACASNQIITQVP